MSQALINSAVITDAEPMLELVLSENADREFPAFSSATINREKTLDTVRYWITKPEPLVFVAKENDQIVGFIIGETYSPWFSDEKFATDHILYVSKQARQSRLGLQLINIFEKTATTYSVSAIITGQVLANYNSQTRIKYLERTGYTSTTVLYTKDLK